MNKACGCDWGRDMLGLLEEIRGWDHLDGAADGPYWKDRLDAGIKRARGYKPQPLIARCDMCGGPCQCGASDEEVPGGFE